MKRNYAKLRIEPLEERCCPSAKALPATLTGGPGGFQWKIKNTTFLYQAGQFMTNGIKTGGLGIHDAGPKTPTLGNPSHAYTGAFVLGVNYAQFQDPTGTVDVTSTTLGNSTYPILTSNPRVMSGLTTTVQYFFGPKNTVRALYSFTNPSGSAITVPILWGNEMASTGPNTYIVNTSQGNSIFNNSDRFVATADSTNATLGNVWVRFGPGNPALLPSNNHAPGGGSRLLVDKYNLTVPAGQTRRLMFFDQVSTPGRSRPGFNPIGTTLDLWNGGFLAGLTSQQLCETVNWDFSQLPVPAYQIGTGAKQVSIAFDPQGGQYTAAVFSDGSLYMFLPGNSYTYIGNHVLSASVAFTPSGTEILDVVFDSNQLYSYVGTNPGQQIGGPGAQSVSITFDMFGKQWTAAIFGGQRYLFSPSNQIVSTVAGAQSVSIGFNCQNQLVEYIVYSDGNLYRFDTSGVHFFGSGVGAVGLGYTIFNQEQLDVVFQSSDLWQYP